MEHFPILLTTIALPLMSASFVMLFVKQSLNPNKILYSKYVTLLSATLTLMCSIFLIIAFEIGAGYQFVYKYPLLSSLGLAIDLAVDGISLFFILLTASLTLICITISMYSVSKNIKEFLVLFLILEGLSIGVFTTTNLLLFYIFFEATLIPMYLIIGMWGGKNRIYASIKFFLYTLLGSVLFLLVIIFLHNEFGTLSIPELTEKARGLPYSTQFWLWIGTFIAFAVKVPMIPLHTWLPDAHVEAPTSGSMMLAGILLKLGAYGFIRISLPIFPIVSLELSPYVMFLSILAIIYASMLAIAQTDMKKTIAYSSIAHMGYVTGGIFSFTIEGINGAIFQMISHAIVSAALFMVVGVLYERLGTKDIKHYGGVANKMPNLAFIFMIFVLSSVGLPGTSGFVGEFYSLIGIYKYNIYAAILGALGIILGAVYMLRLYKNVMLGEIKNESINNFSDLSMREIWCFIPLVITTMLIGLFPSLITMYFREDVINLLGKMGAL